jgi:hypothetical protein
MNQRKNLMLLPTITTLALWVRRAARQRRLWFVLVIVLGASAPVAVEATPGIELSEEALHGSRARAHARLVRSDTFVSRAAPTIRVASVRLPRRPMLERSKRPIICSGVRKTPAAVCDSPVTTPDH